MLSQEVIKRLRKDPDFQSFMEYVQNYIDTVDGVRDLIDLDDTKAGQTARVRALTVSSLKAIFQPVVEYSEKPGHTQEDYKAALKRAGLN